VTEPVARVAVGRVMRAHGVHGEVSVMPHTENPDRFVPGSTLTLEDGRALTVAAARSHHGRELVRFEEIAGRDDAEGLRGSYLFVPVADLPGLPVGTFWPHELEGCAVVTEGGRALGTLKEVLAGPPEGNDVWTVQGQTGVTLVPAVRDAVVSVDVAARRIVVREDRLS